MTISAQNEIDFDQLGGLQERSFVPKHAKLTELKEIQSFYEQLLQREIGSSEELKQWVLDRSELEAALHQVETISYIRMTCQTDDQKKAEAYKHFIEKIHPEIKPYNDQCNKKYLTEAEKFPLDSKRYQIYDRTIRTDVELFIKENIPLQTGVDLLSQEYQTVCAAMTVQFDGKEQTLPQMSKYLLNPERSIREKAWRAMALRRLQEREKLDEIFDKMLTLRNNIALNAKCSNFCEYTFKAFHRFDYTPDDCKAYHKTVEDCLLPLYAQILEQRKKKMQLESLRPWDTSVDPAGRPALKPFGDVSELISGCKDIFNRVDKDLGQQFSEISDRGLLDLASRKGKAPGGYQSTLDESRKPFIFMNAVGLDGDVRTLLHESGHAFHALACAHDPLVDYRHGPMEFNEVASMAMELLADQYMDAFYSGEDARRSRVDHLEDIIFVLIWVATIDAFQHWIYENPGHSCNERKVRWLQIRKRFGGNLINWDGFENEHGFLWHRQLHVFEYPFYYIEYGIAQLGALQLWLNAKKDLPKTVSQYKEALSLGGSRPLPELYKRAGIKFDFSAQTIHPLVKEVQRELDQNNGI